MVITEPVNRVECEASVCPARRRKAGSLTVKVHVAKCLTGPTSKEGTPGRIERKAVIPVPVRLC